MAGNISHEASSRSRKVRWIDVQIASFYVISDIAVACIECTRRWTMSINYMRRWRRSTTLSRNDAGRIDRVIRLSSASRADKNLPNKVYCYSAFDCYLRLWNLYALTALPPSETLCVGKTGERRPPRLLNVGGLKAATTTTSGFMMTCRREIDSISSLAAVDNWMSPTARHLYTKRQRTTSRRRRRTDNAL